MVTAKKRRVRQQVRLAFEILEQRTLLAASPMSGGMGGHDGGHNGHRRDHHPPAAHPQNDSARSQPRHGDHGRRGHGGPDGESPSRDSRTQAVVDTVLPPLTSQPAPPPPRPPVAPPLVIPTAPATDFTVEFTDPLVIPQPASISPIVGTTASLSNAPADLVTDGPATSLPAEGELSIAVDTAPEVTEASALRRNATEASVRSTEPQTTLTPATPDHFMAFAARDLLEADFTFVDEHFTARRAALVNELKPASARNGNEGVFVSSSRGDDPQADATDARPFRRGFVDIGELLDELPGTGSGKEQTVEDDESLDFVDAAEPVQHVEWNRLSRGDDWQLQAAMRTSVELPGDVEPSTSVEADVSTAEGGMVELAHEDAGHPALGVQHDQMDEAVKPAANQPSFLKLEGGVARYQAFEIIAVQATDERAPVVVPVADGDAQEPPVAEDVTENVSTGVRDGDANAPAARAAIAPALFALFAGRRWCRRKTRSR